MKLKNDSIVKLIVLYLVIVATLIFVYIKSYGHIYHSSVDIFVNTAIKSKEEEIESIIDRIMDDIKASKERKIKIYKNDIDEISDTIISNKYTDLSKQVKKHFANLYKSREFKVIVYDKNISKITYTNEDDISNNNYYSSDDIENLKKKYIYNREVEYSKSKYLIIGVKEEYIDNSAKEYIKDKIKDSSEYNEENIWVHEVIDYDSGDRFARELVSPNTSNNKSKYLSIETKDAKGNLYVKEISDNIKNKGESLTNYYSLNNSDGRLSENIYYCKLYKEYNWIIGIELYKDDVLNNIKKNFMEYKYSLVMHFIFMINAILLLFIIAIILIIWVRIYENNKRKFIEYENEVIKRHYKIIEAKQDKTNKIIHDFKNHLIVIKELANKGNLKETNEYIKNLYSNTRELDYIIISGNKVVDIILNEKLNTMNIHQINFEYDLFDFKFGEVEKSDLSVILSNILDNAIEGALNSKERNIYLKICDFNNRFNVIKVRNSCEKEPVFNNGRLKTTKKNKDCHGYGIKNIKLTLEKYDGNIDFKYDKETRNFEVIIIIPKK